MRAARPTRGRTRVADDDLDLTDVWTRTLDSLGDTGMTPQQRAFVSLTRPLALIEDTALIAAPNEFTKDVLESKLRPLVVDALSRTLGREVRIAVTVDPAIAPALDEDATDDLADSTYADPVAGEFGAAPAPAPTVQSPSLDSGRGAPPTNPEPVPGRRAPAARRPAGSTRSTPSTRSSSARATGLPTQRPSRSPSSRPRPTTRCSSTASPDSARPTCCTRSGTTPARCTPAPGSAT
jgi:chromosomal replication initiator protein